MGKLEELYDAGNFKKLGLDLVTYLADYLHEVSQDRIPTNAYLDPEEALEFWQSFMDNDASTLDYYKKIVEHSIHIHNPNYVGHQVCAPAPIAAFGGLVSDLLNNGMAVYEMGGASNPLEKMATDMICRYAGYSDQAAGFMTSGGTLANLTALLTARNVKVPADVWEDGLSSMKLGVMVSEEAHYCIDRAARIMGLGAEGIIKLPVDEAYRVSNETLALKLNEARGRGIHVFAIVASSCSTSTGSYDDIEGMAKFAKEHDIWLHVDGAHGGAVVFSDKYKHLVRGVEKADSFIVDCHKMMMTPTLCTAVLYRDRRHTLRTFRQQVDYLFDESEQYDWWNSGKRTFECTKLMMSIKMMALVKHSGEEIFGEIVDRLYDRAKEFSSLVEADGSFELGLVPQANILCFRYLCDNSDKVNVAIRQRILEEGNFYIVQTRLEGRVYLRTSVMNPMTTLEHFRNLLEEIKRLGSLLQN